MAQNYDIIIVGGGPAGMTAAIYARRAGKRVLLLQGTVFGGQIALSPQVDNYPGIGSISGIELSDRLYAQAKGLGADILPEEAAAVQDGPVKTVLTSSGSYTCTALILATGMRHRTLDLPGEDTISGVSYCAVCDGAFYRGRDAAVYGGGSSALQEALFLSEQCRHVTLIHRRDTFRGDPVLVEAVKARENVTLVFHTVIQALESGNGSLTGLHLVDTATGKKHLLPVSALFVAIGYQPQTALAASLGLTDSQGFLAAGEDCATALPGIFAAGDCRAKQVRQLVTACADGACAALSACRYLKP